MKGEEDKQGDQFEGRGVESRGEWKKRHGKGRGVGGKGGGEEVST